MECPACPTSERWIPASHYRSGCRTCSQIAYTCDLLGRVKTFTERGSATGSSYTTEYKYDAFGNINWVKDPTGGITTMTYDVGNRLKTRLLPNSVTTTYESGSRGAIGVRSTISIVSSGAQPHQMA